MVWKALHVFIGLIAHLQKRERLFLPETSSLMSDFKMLHVSFQNGWDGLIDRTVAFLDKICFCKSFDLSRRSEICLLTSFLHMFFIFFHLYQTVHQDLLDVNKAPFFSRINFLFYLLVTRKFSSILIIAQKVIKTTITSRVFKLLL